MSENDLQQGIMRYLQGIVEPTGRGVFARTNSAKGLLMGWDRNPANAHPMQTGREGWPDISGVFDGKAFFVEVKTPTGSVSDEQEYMHRRLRQAGATVIVARSVRDVENATIPRKQLTVDESPVPF